MFKALIPEGFFFYYIYSVLQQQLRGGEGLYRYYRGNLLSLFQNEV